MQFMLKGTLEDGVKEKQLDRNPLTGMSAAKVPKSSKKDKVMVFQDHEVDLFFSND
jgi:hypothetical protein